MQHFPFYISSINIYTTLLAKYSYIYKLGETGLLQKFNHNFPTTLFRIFYIVLDLMG